MIQESFCKDKKKGVDRVLAKLSFLLPLGLCLCGRPRCCQKKMCKDVMLKQATMKALKSVSPLHPVPTATLVPSWLARRLLASGYVLTEWMFRYRGDWAPCYQAPGWGRIHLRLVCCLQVLALCFALRGSSWNGQIDHLLLLH